MSAAKYVEDYRPRAMTPAAWRVVGASVQASLLTATSTVAAAKKYGPHVAAYAAWAHEQGTPTRPDLLFDLDLIERYISIGMSGCADSTRAARRTVLRTVARRVSPDLRTLPDPPRFSYRRIRPPYTPHEVRAFLRLAHEQPTPGRRSSMQAVLTLGLGCGLDGRDLGWVRGVDIDKRPDDAVAVTVCGGTRPRTVIALNDHAAQLADLAAKAGEQLLIGGSTLGRHNVTSAPLNRLLIDRSLPRLIAARLRSTWLTEHLRLRTPLPVLMSAAGLSTIRPLEDLLGHLPDVSDEAAATYLRGPAA